MSEEKPKRRFSLGLLRNTRLLVYPAFILFILSLLYFGFVPYTWIILLVILFLIFLKISYKLSHQKHSALFNLNGSLLNILLAIVLLLTAIYLPGLKSRIDKTFFYDAYTARTKVKTGSETFSIYVAGNDEEGYPSTFGRFDVNLVITCNPKTNQILITSIPRDTYLPNPAYNYNYDKLTHLGIDSVENSMQGLSEYLGINIDAYVVVNFSTFRNIIDAMGGIEIDNPYAFASYISDYYYEEGEITLTGDEALYYVRERYNLANGDFDRNQHQVLMLKAILKKMANPATIIDYYDILETMQENILTNFTMSQITAYSRSAFRFIIPPDIISQNISGSTGSASCAAAGGQYLSVVFASDESLSAVKEKLIAIYNNETISED